MITLEPGGVEFLPGRWRGILLDGQRTARISCPGCGAIGLLSDHEISKDGSVSPSVCCYENCGFHNYIFLRGWGVGVSILKETTTELPGSAIRERFPDADLDPEEIYNLQTIYIVEPKR